jgi:hypothetical protein
MSHALRTLETAVKVFASRPLDEQVDPARLRDVVEQLEYEYEMLFEPAEERAASRAEVEAWAKKMFEAIAQT